MLFWQCIILIYNIHIRFYTLSILPTLHTQTCKLYKLIKYTDTSATAGLIHIRDNAFYKLRFSKRVDYSGLDENDNKDDIKMTDDEQVALKENADGYAKDKFAIYEKFISWFFKKTHWLIKMKGNKYGDLLKGKLFGRIGFMMYKVVGLAPGTSVLDLKYSSHEDKVVQGANAKLKVQYIVLKNDNTFGPTYPPITINPARDGKIYIYDKTTAETWIERCRWGKILKV